MPGASYETYRVLELWADSVEPERKGMSRRKMTRMLAPQTSEAPLFFHLTDASSKGFRHAVDQMHAVGGFDMLIYSFGSGFKLEDTVRLAHACSATSGWGPSKTLPSSDVVAVALRAGPDVPLSAQVGHCLCARERHRGRRLYDDSFLPRGDAIALPSRPAHKH